MRIKPPQDLSVPLKVKLPSELHAQLDQYRSMLGPKTKMDYVVAEALRAFLSGDRDFRKRLADEQPRASAV